MITFGAKLEQGVTKERDTRELSNRRQSVSRRDVKQVRRLANELANSLHSYIEEKKIGDCRERATAYMK